ncbi:single hybrid motif-containing protein, partial [Sistotremastrum niveocremeum HHB9708]
PLAGISSSARRAAVSKFLMPAMSPTMSEGGIAQWKKQEGDSFVAGDILLEIETDKATIDVEAQDDGVLGKIILPDGTKNVPVGKLIGLLAEEGDDISNLKVPEEDTSASRTQEVEASKPPETSSPPPEPSPNSSQTATTKHDAHKRDPSKPIFPSVMRLLEEYNVSESDIKGTGRRGMLTKGDVLAFLGKASSPTGTYKPPKDETGLGKGPVPPKAPEPPKVRALDGPSVRRLIVQALYEKSRPATPRPTTTPDFDSIVNDYLPPSSRSSTSPPTPPTRPASQPADKYLDGLY